jgi:hypothetical protein
MLISSTASVKVATQRQLFRGARPGSTLNWPEEGVVFFACHDRNDSTGILISGVPCSHSPFEHVNVFSFEPHFLLPPGTGGCCIHGWNGHGGHVVATY